MKARNALGVCSSVRTDDASWMTANAIAAISSGPPSADATTQRMTNHDDALAEVAAAVVRAVPHTISSTGSSGITPSSRPPIEIGYLVHPQPHAGDRAEGARHVAVGDEQLKQHHRRDDDQRNQRRAERDPDQVTGLACPCRAVVLHSRRATLPHEPKPTNRRTGARR